ncbi:MAG TPA: 3-hydroxyacyl-ACP dehydratase FabZ family protein [Vicinamibacterales bacterium]|nr:3-hydroxyacyl-ACP dehydratase FabZ family protein [Vicinamibacterales bacterium]
MDPAALPHSLTRSVRRAPLWMPVDGDAALTIGRHGIERLLPHRDPFLLLDEITAVDLDARAIRGRRRIDPGDPVFRGHFPGRPVYPGVLQLEIIGQLGLCLLHFLAAGSTALDAGTRPRDTRAVRIQHAQFQEPVVPGDDLTLVCRAVDVNDFTALCAGQIWRGGTLCSFGFMEVYFVDG